MKLIVTGATGFVGKEVVSECVRDPAVTSILVLTRRPIDADLAASPKVTTIIHNNFGYYPDELLAQLDGAHGCIWALGGKVESFPDIETARKVGIDYTVAAANAFATRLNSRAVGQLTTAKFCFTFCGARFAEWNAGGKLWLAGDDRRLKGEVEQKLIEIAQQNQDTFQVTLFRPGGILENTQERYQGLINKIISVVSVNQLATAMIAVCLQLETCDRSYRILENEEIVNLLKEERKTRKADTV